MSKHKQARMFATDDLPLFSGTAPGVTIETFDTTPQDEQLPMILCDECRDTGVLGFADFCECPAGDEAAKLYRLQMMGR